MSERVEDDRSVMMAADPMFTIGRLRDEIQTLRGIINDLDSSYKLAYNSAAGLTNYCEPSGSTKKCERELEQAEALYRSIDMPR